MIKNQKQKIRFYQPGFTLMELLVSITIIGAVATISVVNFRSYGFQGQVDLTALKLSSDLRLVQSYSFGLKEYDDGNAGTDNRPDGGWGIYFDARAGNDDHYTVFADHWDGTTPEASNMRRDNGEDKTVIDTGNVTIESLTIGDPPVPTDEMSILIQPPDPTIWICDYVAFCSTTTEAAIVFSNSGREARVLVNTFGLIDVND